MFHTVGEGKLDEGGAGNEAGTDMNTVNLASFLGFPAPELECVHVGRAWYSFSCEHDVIAEFIEQKSNI